MAVDDWYFINTVKGRQTLALARQGKLEGAAQGAAGGGPDSGGAAQRLYPL
jgi:hypothetical protein